MLRQSDTWAVTVWRAFVPVGFTVALVGLFCATGLGASLYRCTDASGASVFTNTPIHYDKCEALESYPEPSSEEPSGRASASPRTSPLPAAPPGANVSAMSVPAESPGRVTVPVQRVGNLLIVSTQVNDSRDARLILDTGASTTILSYGVAEDLGLLPDPQSQFVTLKTAGGPVEAELARVDSIRIAGAEVRDTLVAIYDMPDAPEGVEGLLGLTFLQQFQVTLDAAQGLLHLHRPDR